jgi:hypothetical protein
VNISNRYAAPYQKSSAEAAKARSIPVSQEVSGKVSLLVCHFTVRAHALNGVIE